MGQTHSSGDFFHDVAVKDHFRCIQTLWTGDELARSIQRLKDTTLNFALDKVKFAKLLQLSTEYEASIAAWFQEFTRDRLSQVVDGLEFLASAILVSKLVSLHQKICLLFSLFDLDQSGSMRKDEFAIFLKSATTGLHNMVSGLPAPPEEVHHLSVIANSFFKAVPGGQFISRQEFVTWMTEDPISLRYLGMLSQLGTALFAMGANHRCQMGLYSQPRVQHVPAPMLALEGIKIASVASHESHSLFLTQEGQVLSCGKGFCGILGHGTVDDCMRPKLIESIGHVRIIDVAVGIRHSAAVSSKGQVFTWGAADLGQLGHGDVEDDEVHEIEYDPRTGGNFSFISKPTVVMGLFGKRISIKQVSCCNFATLALTSTGQMYSWGNNTDGQCGIGKKSPGQRLLHVELSMLRASVHVVTDPVLIEAGDTRFNSISAGGQHVLAVDDRKRIWTWGHGLWGKLGHGNGDASEQQTLYEPTLLDALKHHICEGTAAGEAHSVCMCAMYKLTVSGDAKSAPVSYLGLPSGKVDAQLEKQQMVTASGQNFEKQPLLTAPLIQVGLPFHYHPGLSIFDPQMHPADVVQKSILLISRSLCEGNWLKLETSEFDFKITMSTTSASLGPSQPSGIVLLSETFQAEECSGKICVVDLSCSQMSFQALHKAVLDAASRCQKGSGQACMCILPDKVSAFDINVPEDLRVSLSSLPVGVMEFAHGEQLKKDMEISKPDDMPKGVLLTITEDSLLHWLEDICASRPKGIILSQTSWRPSPELLVLPQSLLDALDGPVVVVSFDVGEKLRDQLNEDLEPSVTLEIEPCGAIYAWGLGTHGQLGLAGIAHRSFLQTSTDERSTEENLMTDRPCYVSPLHGEQVTGIACGAAHTVAVTASGKVFSWGADHLGATSVKLGDKMRALPDCSMQMPKDFFQAGDTGTVVKMEDNYFQIAWDRTRERTDFSRSMWPGWTRWLELQSKASSRPSSESCSHSPMRIPQLEGIAKATKVFSGHNHSFVSAGMSFPSVLVSEK